jgi:hypothetical protein
VGVADAGAPMTTASTGAVAELRRGRTAVRVRQAPGGPLEGLQLGGVDLGAAGAWTEWGPTLAACTLPSYVAGLGGLALPDGGSIGATAPTLHVTADGQTTAITARWEPDQLPFGLVRTIRTPADDVLQLDYEARNHGTVRLPFVWGLRIPLPWDAAWGVELPAGTRMRLAAAWGQGLPAVGSAGPWPQLRVGSTLADLSTPARMPRGAGVVAYAAAPGGTCTLRTPDGAVAIAGSPALLTHLRVLAEHEAPLPGRAPHRFWHRGPRPRTASVAPTIGAPDALSDALGDWKGARWLEPGATLSWSLTLSLPPATD